MGHVMTKKQPIQLQDVFHINLIIIHLLKSWKRSFHKMPQILWQGQVIRPVNKTINTSMRSTQNTEDEQFLYLLPSENTSYLFPLKRRMLLASKKKNPLLEFVLKLTTIIFKSMTLKISELYSGLNFTRAGPGLSHLVKSNRILPSVSSKNIVPQSILLPEPSNFSQCDCQHSDLCQ